VKNGVPFDVAFAWDEAFVLAAVVIFGEQEGGEFDWSDMRWKRRE
jgi:hypothetical protein